MALTLTRRPGERIRIGCDIIIDVGKIQSGSVVLHIEAPRDLAITRADADLRQPPPPRRQPPDHHRRRSPEPVIEVRRRSTKRNDD